MHSPDSKPFKITFGNCRMAALSTLVSARIKAEYYWSWRREFEPTDDNGWREL